MTTGWSYIVYHGGSLANCPRQPWQSHYDIYVTILVYCVCMDGFLWLHGWFLKIGHTYWLRRIWLEHVVKVFTRPMDQIGSQGVMRTVARVAFTDTLLWNGTVSCVHIPESFTEWNILFCPHNRFLTNYNSVMSAGTVNSKVFSRCDYDH